LFNVQITPDSWSKLIQSSSQVVNSLRLMGNSSTLKERLLEAMETLSDVITLPEGANDVSVETDELVAVVRCLHLRFLFLLVV